MSPEPAILMSVIASCKANLVEPWAWLSDRADSARSGKPLESLPPNTARITPRAPLDHRQNEEN
ncbi:MAG: hypothetical protein U0936_27620 [Planctomycetaceae bacterium]